jgi:hypothetical protein
VIKLQNGKRLFMWYRYSQQLQLPGMDVAQKPIEKKPEQDKQPNQELFETQKEPRSLFFNDWAKGYKVPEQPLYHGTTKDFDRFDITKGFGSSWFGPGFYFTSDEGDAIENYTVSNNRNDKENNIDRIMYQLSEESDWDDYYLYNNYGSDPRYKKYFNADKTCWNIQELTKKIAEDMVLGENNPRVIPAHVRMKNPLHLTSQNDEEHPEKIFLDDADGDVSFLEEQNNLDTTNASSYKSIISNLFNILLDYYESDTAYGICETLVEATSSKYNKDGVSATLMFDVLIPLLKGADSNQDDEHLGQIVQRLVYSLGHDSVVMDPNEFFRMYAEEGKKVKHYLTWNPEDIKHARQNIEFDPKNPVITASKKYAQLEPETNEEWLVRHKVQREGDKYVFYHGSRINLTELRGGSLLATSPKEAIDFGDTNYWNDRRASFKVYKVKVSPEEIHPGFWASLVSNHPVELYYRVSRKKGS